MKLFKTCPLCGVEPDPGDMEGHIVACHEIALLSAKVWPKGGVICTEAEWREYRSLKRKKAQSTRGR